MSGDSRKILRCWTTSHVKLTDAERGDLAALMSRTPDTDDIPEAPAGNWQGARGFHEFRNKTTQSSFKSPIA
jgi:hypothetical protein